MTNPWKTKKERVQDLLYDMAKMSFQEIAETVVDLEIQMEMREGERDDLREKLKSLQAALEQLHEAHERLDRDHELAVKELEQAYQTLERTEEELQHLKSLSTILNYRKDNVA